MRTLRHALPRLMLLALLPSFAYAASAAADSPILPSLTLQAQATREVPQDTARAAFFVEKESPVAADAQAQVNRLLGEAVTLAKKNAAFTVTTLGYSTYPIYDGKNAIRAWRVRGELQIESKDFAKLSDEAAILGKTVNLNGISFYLSREARQSVENSLIQEAAGAFQEKARQTALAFGKSHYKLKEMALQQDNGMPYLPQPRMIMAAKVAMVADTAPVPLEAGKSTVTVTMSGSVLLED